MWQFLWSLVVGSFNSEFEALIVYIEAMASSTSPSHRFVMTCAFQHVMFNCSTIKFDDWIPDEIFNDIYTWRTPHFQKTLLWNHMKPQPSMWTCWISKKLTPHLHFPSWTVDSFKLSTFVFLELKVGVLGVSRHFFEQLATDWSERGPNKMRMNSCELCWQHWQKNEKWLSICFSCCWRCGLLRLLRDAVSKLGHAMPGIYIYIYIDMSLKAKEGDEVLTPDPSSKFEGFWLSSSSGTMEPHRCYIVVVFHQEKYHYRYPRLATVSQFHNQRNL